jgi:hypothetical protein
MVACLLLQPMRPSSKRADDVGLGIAVVSNSKLYVAAIWQEPLLAPTNALPMLSCVV